jgi:hypothetical protein
VRVVSRAVALGVLLVGGLQAPRTARAQGMATADRIQGPGWWPTKGTPPRSDYVGAAACARCHKPHAATQPATSMARTAARAELSEVFREHPALSFRLGRYSYRVDTGGGQSVYTVTDGTRSVSAPLSWALGVGRVGQTWLFERDGRLYESRMSYYDSIKGLDFTPARALPAPRDVEEAMGRAVDGPEARRCLGCHTTASTTDNALDLAHLVSGVTCEACHGPGARHVAAIEQDRVGEARQAVLNPRTLDPAASVDFCGACHATWWDVTLANETGIAALRSQPYRLESSRCWGKGDARLTCVACHEPHRPRESDPAFYDTRCLSCHVSGKVATTREHPGRACPVATGRCVTCHMPKYDVPWMHTKFTDHLIRVVNH